MAKKYKVTLKSGSPRTYRRGGHIFTVRTETKVIAEPILLTEEELTDDALIGFQGLMRRVAQ